MKKQSINIKDKLLLSIHEASALSGLGINKLQTLVRSPQCQFVIRNGNKRMIKSKALQDYLANHDEI